MNSIRHRLLAALLGALLLAGVAATVGTFLSARDEVARLLDEELRQVAYSLRDHARLDLSRLDRGYNPDLRVLVQIWDPAFERPYSSRIAAALPKQREEGYVTLLHEGREWRLFTALSGPQTIQVAQPTALRTELAALAAGRLLVPVLIALPLLALLGWWLVGRGLAPLTALAETLERRAPTSLAPIALTGVPVEARPLVDALNALLGRLADAFESQRRFAADAAHELRSPLTALTLQIQLARRATLPEEQAIAFDRLEQGAKRATRLVQQLLTMARLDPEAAAQPVVDVDLAALARSAADEIGPAAAGRGVAVAVDAVPTLLPGQEDALRILLGNLLDNAVRHTPAGGRIRLTVRKGRGHAELDIEDSGPGIPAHERGRVFDRFYRGGEAPPGGSGLGLAIVRQVVQMHQGAVELSDSAWGGLRVSVRLPTPSNYV